MLTDCEVQSFLKGEGNKYTKRKTEIYIFRALVLAFLSAEKENRQQEDLPLADYGCFPERLLLSVRTKSINENFLKRKLRQLLFL